MSDRHHHPDDELLAALSEQYDAGFYEPWTPKVGQWVRIKLSGECRKRFVEVDDDDRPISTDPVGHVWACDGEAGIVTEIGRGPSVMGWPREGHFYTVKCAHGTEPFAAVELIPLTDDAARPSAAREEG